MKNKNSKKNKNLLPNFPVPQVHEKQLPLTSSYTLFLPRRLKTNPPPPAPILQPPNLKAESDKMSKSFGFQTIFN